MWWHTHWPLCGQNQRKCWGKFCNSSVMKRQCYTKTSVKLRKHEDVHVKLLFPWKLRMCIKKTSAHIRVLKSYTWNSTPIFKIKFISSPKLSSTEDFTIAYLPSPKKKKKIHSYLSNKATQSQTLSPFLTT